MDDYASKLEENIRKVRESRARHARQMADHEIRMRIVTEGFKAVFAMQEVMIQVACTQALIPKPRRWWWFR